MTRRERSVHSDVFADAKSFDEQLYHALRRSPWWMISIGAHVLLFVLSALLQAPSEGVPAPAGVLLTQVPPAVEPPPEAPDPTPDPDVVDGPDPQLDPVREPVPDPDVLQPEPETENDSTAHSTQGNEGLSRADFDGPSTNPAIGLGPGAGNRLGRRDGPGGDGRKGTPGGSSKPSEDAVLHALRWLAAHQSPDGRWEAEGFGRWANGKPAVPPGPDGPGKSQYDVGVTGLSLLAFLGAGYTPRSSHEFGRVVGAGLRWLRNVQDAEGCFGARATQHFVYDHAIATLAMVEAFGMTGSALWKGPAQKGLDFVGIARNPYLAWRYGVKPGDDDTSVTGWMMMALKSARLVDAADLRRGQPPSLVFDEDAFDGIRSWVDRMTDPETGRVGYQVRGSGPARPLDLVDRFPQERSESMTAVGVLARVFLGENPKTSKAVRDGAALCAKCLPTWNREDGSIDMYYWYYGTLAIFQVGDEPWAKWNGAMKKAVVDTQRLDGDYDLYKGSWDPVDPWGKDGGRVYSTAVMAMCLEVYYRYERVFGTGVEPSPR